MDATITVGKRLKLEGPGLGSRLVEQLEARLVFLNPKWVENKRRGYSNWNTRKTLSYLNVTKTGALTMPRGLAGQVRSLLGRHGISYEVIDNTRRLDDVDFSFRGRLYDYQEEAVSAVLSRRFGVLQAPTASGKTIMALKIVAERRQPALVIVHSRELLYQWMERAEEFLGLDRAEIGQVGDGKNRTGKRLTLAIVNSLYKRASEISKKIGFLVVDECHRTPARTFTSAVAAFDCSFMLGLSATPFRKDRLTRLIHFYLGDTVHSIDYRSLQQQNRIMKGTLHIRHTNFDYPYNDDYTELVAALVENHERNSLIVADVVEDAARGGGMALVVSDRVEHCHVLARMIEEMGLSTAVLTGSLKDEERTAVIERLKAGDIRVLIATVQLIGEGFDLPDLSSLFLATPISFQGRVIQTIGRILRTAAGKTEAVVYDYVDQPGILRHAFGNRLKVYRKFGFEEAKPESD